jgi:acyl dehydratase
MARLAPYRVEAYNTAKLSENRMHDDSVAQKYGFKGGLVPGVDVLAYMIHAPVERWGEAFLQRGFIEARFIKPVYDGEIILIKSEEADGTLALTVEGDEMKTSGKASLTGTIPTFSLADFPNTAPVTTRMPAGPTSYQIGRWLGTTPRSWDEQATIEYCAEVRETHPIYARKGLVHPGVLQRIMNRVLMENALLGPWIHIGSRMQLLAAAACGDELTARARVTGNYEKNAHRFVEVDALIVANDQAPVAYCSHFAIYQLRTLK